MAWQGDTPPRDVTNPNLKLLFKNTGHVRLAKKSSIFIEI
jgi:hypothetical protein